MITHPRQNLLSEPGFDVTLTVHEIEPGVLMHFVHVIVYRMTPSTLKRLLQLWPLVRAALPSYVFCCGEHDDDKHRRFVARFGWQPISDAPCEDGETRRIYVHYL